MNRTLCTLALLLMTLTISEAAAQDTSRADIAVGYTYIHSNAPPSGCGCFNFNGGSISASWKFDPRWSIVGDLDIAHAGNIDSTTLSPTMTTYLAGPRYRIAKGTHRTVPFANVLVGGAHASNGYFPNGATSSTSATGFSMSAGGGIDFNVGKHLAIRPIDAEYLLTTFPNNVNGRQNNFRLTSALVFRFGQR